MKIYILYTYFYKNKQEETPNIKLTCAFDNIMEASNFCLQKNITESEVYKMTSITLKMKKAN